jgi:hypothetical protein
LQWSWLRRNAKGISHAAGLFRRVQELRRERPYQQADLSGQENRFMPKIDIVSCPMCLAVYERRKERRPQKERGAFTCSCGHLIARWNGYWVLICTKIKESQL